MRKASKTSLKNRCDDIWRDLIRKTYCEICGKSGGMFYSHHIIGRKNKATRWDLRNGINLDFSCHVGTKESVHEDWPKFREWLLKNRPDDYEYLLIKKREEVKLTIQFYQDTLRRLQGEWTLKVNED